MTPEQREFFDTNGYLMIEDAIEGTDLERVQKSLNTRFGESDVAYRLCKTTKNDHGKTH